MTNNDKKELIQLILGASTLTDSSKFKLLGINEDVPAGQTLVTGEFDVLHAEAVATNITNNGAVNATYGTVVEAGNGILHRTTITLAGAFGAIVGGTDLALGRLIYTFPAGVIRVNTVFLNGLALQQTEGNVTLDTPDVGIGTTLGAGAIATLDAGSEMENLLTGQAFTDCDGTAERLGAPTPLATCIIDAAADHTVHLNIADGWAASGDLALGFTGDVIITWELLS
jgi:hypothetical protein